MKYFNFEKQEHLQTKKEPEIFYSAFDKLFESLTDKNEIKLKYYSDILLKPLFLKQHTLTYEFALRRTIDIFMMSFLQISFDEFITRVEINIK